MSATPGPWEWEGNALVIVDGTVIWKTGAWADGLQIIPGKRDKALIAAAPDLLEACKALIAAASTSADIVAYDDYGHPLNARGLARKQALAAIAKATP